MNSINERNDLQEIIDNVLKEMSESKQDDFSLAHINLAEFCRRSGITRSKARTLQKNDFKVMPHKRCGTHAQTTVLTGYTDKLDSLLKRGVTNSTVCFERIVEKGYKGSLTTVKNYLSKHAYLVPAKRSQNIASQGNRGRRYHTKPGECYQMDWGFVKVIDSLGDTYRLACFALNCHHCSTCYIEFFPNARQENLFIGMIHAFLLLGVPEYILTDNMKSVVIRRDIDNKPVWQADYAAFMSCVGFKTKLCKPRHPFTKGKVERLIKFVKDNFLVDKTFVDITQLNIDALQWCDYQGKKYRRCIDGISHDMHYELCSQKVTKLELTEEASMYLCPVRKISFDGFIHFEGRRFGVPYWYSEKLCRVSRDNEYLRIFSFDLTRELVVHLVTWTRLDSYCVDQYPDNMPYELPSTTPTCAIKQIEHPIENDRFSKFKFDGGK